jgi:hypothetical protein
VDPMQPEREPTARLVAAAFATEAQAGAADRLLRRLGVPAEAFRVAPLGQASDPSGPGAVLAGRFEQDLLEAVHLAVEAAGGTVLVIRDWSEPR